VLTVIPEKSKLGLICNVLVVVNMYDHV